MKEKDGSTQNTLADYNKMRRQTKEIFNMKRLKELPLFTLRKLLKDIFQ